MWSFHSAGTWNWKDLILTTNMITMYYYQGCSFTGKFGLVYIIGKFTGNYSKLSKKFKN